jgi:hypothetical protein
MGKKSIVRHCLPRAVGHHLHVQLTSMAEHSAVRHLLLEDDEREIGVLVDIDEFNLLMKMADLAGNPAALAELAQDDKEDEEGLTFEQVFE